MGIAATTNVKLTIADLAKLATFFTCATIYCFLSASAVRKARFRRGAAGTESEGSNERYSRGSFGGRRRGTALSSHSRSSQARGHLRWHLSHHRHHAFQLPELRPASRLHPYPVQGTVTQPAHPRGL